MISQLTRKELYEHVWKTPLTKISREFQVSYHMLRNTCKEREIPLPQSGHWTRIQLGKSIIMPPLPEFQGSDVIDLVRLRTIKRINIPSAIVAKDLPLLVRSSNPDPLVSEAKKFLSSKESYERDGLLITRRGMLSVKVSSNELSRAMIILDAFIKMVKKRRYEVTIRNDESYVVILGKEIRFSLREKTNRVPNQNSRYSFDQTIMKPIAILVFKMWSYHEKEWQDGAVKLDHQLESIILKFEDEARFLKDLHQQAEKRHDEYKELERQKQAVADRKKKELEDFKLLTAKSQRWHQAVILRNYIEEFRKRVSQDGTLTEEQLEWISWAKAKRDCFDPFC
jgi:hypothetical protein